MLLAPGDELADADVDPWAEADADALADADAWAEADAELDAGALLAEAGAVTATFGLAA